MENLLQEIKAELKKILPEHLSEKEKYATKKEISDFEKESGLKFPEELVTFWLHCDFYLTVDANIFKKLNCKEAKDTAHFTFNLFKYMVRAWNEDSGKELSEYEKSYDYFTFKGRGFAEGIICETFFDKGWFPIAQSDGSLILVDMNPGVNGTYGQLLYMMFVSDGK